MAKAARMTTTPLTSTRGLVSFASMHANLPQRYFRTTSGGSSPANSQKIPSSVRWTGMMNGGPEQTGRLQIADLELDEDSHQVWRAGQAIELTATEFKLLRYLMMNARRVLSKAQILDHVWNYDFGGDGSIVETYISYLRKKVDASEPRLIHTVRGVGYTLRPPG